MGLLDGQLITQTVILHDGSEVELPMEFVEYYCDIRLLVAVADRPDVFAVDHWLKASVNERDGGLRFWNKNPAPVDLHFTKTNNYQVILHSCAAWVESEGGIGIDGGRYTRFQTAWRKYRQAKNGLDQAEHQKRTRAERVWAKIQREAEEWARKNSVDSVLSL